MKNQPPEYLAAAEDLETLALAEHTPGPWIYSRSELNDLWCVYAGRNNLAAAQDPYGTDDAVGKANACLMAAAPEMLAELRRLYTKHGSEETAKVIAGALK